MLCVSSQAYPKYPKCKLCISLQYLQKNMGNYFFFIFYLQINTKVVYKVVVSFWMCITRLSQSTQINKFAISLKIGRMKLIFYLQTTSNISSNGYYHFRCVWLGMPSLSKKISFLFLCFLFILR